MKPAKPKSVSKSEKSDEDDEAYMPENEPFVIKRKVIKEPRKKKRLTEKDSKSQEKKSEDQLAAR